MAKQGEIDYLKNIDQRYGPMIIERAQGKPFSEEVCARYLIDMGFVMTLLPPPPWPRILDIGVGTGWTSTFYARRGYPVVGQDIAPDMIALANQNLAREPGLNLKFVVGDFESMPFSQEFEVAIFYDSLHHAVNERAALAKAYQALTPGGVCITVEPGEGHSQDPHAQEAVRLFGVTEKDMSPGHIIDLGKGIGFREFKIYRRQFAPDLLYQSDAPAPSPSPSPSRAHLVRDYLKAAWDAWWTGAPAASLTPASPPTTFAASNIVVMTK